jgi:ssDNA-binding Zn-finger/Zn-ribbon topoisomerase 1
VEEENKPLTPLCPECNLPMAKKTNRLDGRHFWGCLRFPLCRATLPLTTNGMPTETVQTAMRKEMAKKKYHGEMRSYAASSTSSGSWEKAGEDAEDDENEAMDEDTVKVKNSLLAANVSAKEMKIIMRLRKAEKEKAKHLK